MIGLKRYALDASVLLYHYAMGKPRNIENIIRSGLLNLVSISETFYIICRLDPVTDINGWWV